jgi:hypothetical protein
MGNADAAHKEVIEDALENFRGLFRQWVATFKKDEHEDEWGLFLQAGRQNEYCLYFRLSIYGCLIV